MGGEEWKVWEENEEGAKEVRGGERKLGEVGEKRWVRRKVGEERK